jgi:hypothetical protein
MRSHRKYRCNAQDRFDAHYGKHECNLYAIIKRKNQHTDLASGSRAIRSVYDLLSIWISTCN